MNDRLDIFSLTESRERKIKSRLNLFEEVLRKCHKKIKSVSETMESKMFICYTRVCYWNALIQ